MAQTSEIDEIFSLTKAQTDKSTSPEKKITTTRASENEKKNADPSKKLPAEPQTIIDSSSALQGQKASQKLSELDLDFVDSRGSRRKKTEDGLPVYTFEELKIGQGGDTPECPFDCDCCF